MKIDNTGIEEWYYHAKENVPERLHNLYRERLGSIQNSLPEEYPLAERTEETLRLGIPNK